MATFDRREFLALGGTLVVAQASAQQPQPWKPAPPPPRQAMPEAWGKAPSMPIWPGKPPGSGFAFQALPADWSPVFIRNVSTPDLHIFRPERPNGYGLLILPGGSYTFVSAANEGVDVALQMVALGVTVFVLTYRLPGEGWEKRSDVPLQDAQRAMRVIRSQATRFGIDANKVSVLGFSAGGHLAATLATQHAEATYKPVDAADQLSARPLAAGLVYPVVTMVKPWTHEESRKRLLGPAATDAEVERRSAERHVSTSTPPLFTVHAMDDEAVPVENSLRLMNAMREARRPVEAHLIQEGGHAFGVGLPGTPSAHWIELFSTWLARQS
jgi:acetyl esterase/lipase